MASATFQLRAVDETAQAFASVQNRFDRMGMKVKELNASFVGKGLLAGLGIGGGLQVAQTLIEKISDSYKEAADFAKQIEESTKRSLEYTLRAIKEAQTPEQQMAGLRKEQERIIKQRKELQAPVMFMAPAQPGSFFDESKKAGMKEAAKTDEQKKAIASLIEQENALADEMKKVQDKINEGQKKVFDDAETLRKTDQDRKIAAFQTGLDVMEKETDAMIAAQSKKSEAVQKEREALEKLAEGYRDIADPSRVFIRQIDEVNRLAADGKIPIEQAARAVEALTIAMQKNEDSRVNAALNDFFGDIDDETKRINNLGKEMSSLERVSMDAGEMIASSFEDAIFSGQKLGEVVKALGMDLMRLILRQQVTAPLAKGLGEAIFAGFRAEGGPVGAGSAYMVGEKGPELFVPGSSGSIVPNGAMGGGGGNGGASVNETYNIATGVTRAELKPILEQQRAQLRREIPDAVRRGGSYRTAFA
jgi:hypothetical protein